MIVFFEKSINILLLKIIFVSYYYNLLMFELNIVKYIRLILRYIRNFNIDRKNVCGFCGLFFIY